ncbi:hypothetical protein D0864_05019 [Hortaea werneckii]|uniref:Uncharacterized protein n=1 Tax=Hortaea werneckii TaxID=91943 RepID=A0A3M7G757_HORWE|nr:hypothetical protein D0864_05019 [Hortaea werneckii]
MQTTFGLLALFGALCVEHVQAQSQFPKYWCRGFNQTGYYNQAYNQAWQDDSSIFHSPITRRISDAVICNATNVITTGDKNGTCTIEAGGYFTNYAHANVSAGTGLRGDPNGTYFYTEASVRHTVSTMIDAEDADLFYSGSQEGAVREARYYIDEGTNAPTYTEDMIDVDDRSFPVYEGNSYIRMVNQTEAADLISKGNPLEEPRPEHVEPSEAGALKIGSLVTLAGGMVLFFALA